MRVMFFILCFLPLIANAAYERNVAKPVDKVEFAVVESVRYINQQEFLHAKQHGLETFLGAITGGMIGRQFGGGDGQFASMIVGSVMGANLTRHHISRHSSQHVVNIRLVDLLLKKKDGSLIDVIQDVDPQMLFQRGDDVRILYFSQKVRIDKVF